MSDLEWLHALITNDAWALTFQSFGQYRTALLAEIAKREQAQRKARKHMANCGCIHCS